MKKWIIVPTTVIAIALLAIYILVPKTINQSQTVTINCTYGAVNRYLVNDSNWLTWWPANTAESANPQSQANTFLYKGNSFHPHQRMFDAIGVRITGHDLAINSKIVLIPKNKDSVAIQWDYEYATGNNPVTSIQRYLQAGALKKNVNDILAELKLFLEKPENVYGIAIKKTIIKDSLLLSTRQTFTSPPSTQNVYSLINKLKAYIQQQGATETGNPMLNIQPKNSQRFETMVAIPINKVVKEQNDIVMKNLIQGNILVTEVTGGDHTISNAFSQMENYLSDHNYESPAIPFYTLITNRLTETDTTKWITRISYPVL